jgi:lambda family phage portal protein
VSTAVAPIPSPGAVAGALAGLQPTWVDRLVAYFAPSAGVRRLQARATMAVARNYFGAPSYEGAAEDRPAMKNWRPLVRSATADVESSRTPVLARGRDLVRNAPIAAGAEHTIVTSTVGAGLTCNAAIDADFLGLSEVEASAWEAQADRLWEAWQEQADIEGSLHFGDLSALTLRDEFQTGDCFAIRRFIERDGDLFGTRVQLVEGPRVSTPTGLLDHARRTAGVEFDENGQPTKYFVADEVDVARGLIMPTTWQELPARDQLGPLVLHLMRPGRIGQRRGISPLAPVVEQLKQLTQYSHAELTAAVVSAFFTVFIKSKSPETDGPILNTMLAPGGADAPQLASQPRPRQVDLGAGAVVELGEGEDIAIADPKRPNANFDPFVLAILRQIGVTLELPFELLIKHFTASYSASRAAIQEAYRATLTRRTRHVRQFCAPVRRWVMTEAVARGYLQAPGFFSDPLRQRAWLGAEWYGPPISSLNPVDDVDAAERRVTLGVSTISGEAAQLTGGNAERIHRQRVKEVRRRVADGLEAPVGGPIPSPARPPVPSAELIADAA